MTNAVLTGQVHIGKTTICHAVANLARQRGYCVRGILTPPLFDERGARVGIAVLDLANGEKRELARVDCDWNGPHVGTYHFNPAALQWGQDVITRAIAVGCDLLIVDEIGRLELERGEGFSSILPLLVTSAVPRSLLVVRATLLNTFRCRLSELEFITFEVTTSNRDALPLQVAEKLSLI